MRLVISVMVVFAMIMIACNGEVDLSKSIKKEKVRTYFKGFNAKDYNLIKPLFKDSISITEGVEAKFNTASFYEHFKWDSVFNTQYTIKNLSVTDSVIIASIAARSERYAFLENNPLRCDWSFYFKDSVIYNITIGDCPSANWSKWEQKKDSLVAWTAANYPELDNFINDLSEQGAQKYVQAINQYKKDKNQK